MGHTPHTIDPWRGLTHPGWWCALALLALNDHMLKGSGLLPGALTGKLSDVAGMVAAPVLAAALRWVVVALRWVVAALRWVREALRFVSVALQSGPTTL